MALNKGIWDPKLRGTNVKGPNLKSLMGTHAEASAVFWVHAHGNSTAPGRNLAPREARKPQSFQDI